MTGAERLGAQPCTPQSCPPEPGSFRELPESMFPLLVRGCHGDRSRRGHPLVWLYTDCLSQLVIIRGLGQSRCWERLRWENDIVQRPAP